MEFWETIEGGVTLIPNWHIEVICDELQAVYEAWERGESQPDLFINVPPGSSKSTICTQLFPVWLWVRNPSIRIISSSYSSDLSIPHAVKSKDCIQSDKFQLMYGHLFQIKRGEDGKSAYRNNKFGQRFTTSTGGTVMGMHGDFNIVDDPLNKRQAESEVMRTTARKHVFEDLSTRKTDKNRTVTIVIMQRLHEDDPTGFALKNMPGKIKHICIPGELPKFDATGKTGGQVCPDRLREHYVDGLMDVKRLNRSALDGLKVSLGSYGYAGQINQRPAPEGGGQLKTGWFRKISYEDFKTLHDKHKTPINFFLDTAYTEKQENDPTALMANTWIEKTLYILNSEQAWLEFPELLRHIKSYTLRHGYTHTSRIMIEPKASGKSTVQSFKKTEFNVMELPSPTDDKVTRVHNISAMVEAGKVVLVEAPWNDNFLGEAGGFPNASNDDQVDNLVNSLNHYEKGNNKKRVSI